MLFKNRLIYLLLMVSSLPLFTRAQAKFTELPITNEAAYQARGLKVSLLKETYAGLEGQEYSVKFTNISSKKLKLSGNLAAVTFCGNTLSFDFSATIKPGETIGGNNYLMDDVGLTNVVHAEDCQTNKIYTNPNDRTQYVYDRIRSLHLSGLNVTDAEDADNTANTAAKTSGNNNTASQDSYTASRTTTPTTRSTNTRAATNAGSTGTAPTTSTTNSAYNQQVQANQQLQQSINNTFDDLKNNLQQYYADKQAQADQQEGDRKAKQEQADREEQAAKQKQDEENREEERRMEAARERREQRVNHELELNTKLAGDYTGKYVKPRDADVSYPNLKTEYYLAFCRLDNAVTLMAPLKIDKYSDDTWMEEDILNTRVRAFFGDTNKQIPSARDEDVMRPFDMLNIIGYFKTYDEAVAAFKDIRTRAQASGYTIAVTNATGTATPVTNQPAATKPKQDDFWKN